MLTRWLVPAVQAYPNVRAVVPANGYANGSELLLNGADTATNNPTPSHPSSSETTSQTKPKKRLQSFSDISFDDRSDRSGRYLAKIEYDWVATVIERCTFLVFLLAFLFVSLGINFVGFLHWTYSEPPPHAVRTSSPTV
ncbi:hypothetical protein Y032_0186g1090 [Ancylostoma ceylanicum]|uniref:Neurotransmitter-gated ion-channel transmembrane domain-containing protein n=1 Tax=Ancylostoma ceylanicum TaxID=53326 RepID=A0A016SRY6_9BILA|nr:hypothetical protein Y032_0186g1090 [Ancylostoma ceylanicum]